MAEPVWREDVEKEIEYLTEGARSLSLFYYNLKAHGAPVGLLNELSFAFTELDNAKRRLSSILPYIPQEPRTR